MVDFLGFRFRNVRSETGTRFILVCPSPRSQQLFRERVRKYIHHGIPLRIKDQVKNLNRYLRGWVEYFRLGHGSKVFHKLINFVNKRVRHVIWRRRGNRGYGWGKITSEYIYGKPGAVLRLPRHQFIACRCLLFQESRMRENFTSGLMRA